MTQIVTQAPIADACGLAGGTPWSGVAPEEGQYVNTTHAHHGMKGTDPFVCLFVCLLIHSGGGAPRLCPSRGRTTQPCDLC